MSLIPRLPLFAAAFTLLSLALALVFLSGQPVPAALAQTTTPTATTVDYDSNDDRLIEISNLAQLNAVRWDLNGDGTVDVAANRTSYSAAFPNAAAGMGCPDGSDADASPDPCLGYELKADLTFDSNGDGSVTAADSAGLYWNSGAGWTPIGDARRYTYTGQFHGRGKTISHLFINNSSALYVGLFGAVGSGGRITGVGLTEVSLSSRRPAVAGSLVGSNAGTVTASYASGTVSINVGGVTNANSIAGGLTGHNTSTGAAQASFAEVAVSARHSSASAIIGGLTGQNDGNIRASYAAGAVSVTGNTRFTKAGGLAGNNGGTITASYARGRVTASGSGAAAGGLVGGNLRNGRVVASYWDTATSGQTGSAGGTGQNTNALQTPSGYNYTGIYAGWNLNLDGAAGGDSPWYFGGVNQYPLLVYGEMREFPLWDYDADNDQLIEVNNLAQLNAIRWDLNTDGVVAVADQASYTAAFPGAVVGMGCALGTTAAACAGYELMSDLDFDTDGDGDVDAADSGGLYWNNAWGWNPIGKPTRWSAEYQFQGTFQGNGKTISKLYINQPATSNITDSFGLFYDVSAAGVIDGVKLRDVNIRIQAGAIVGTLAGQNYGAIRGSSATGSINSDGTHGESVGGLVGHNYGNITGSYAKTEIASNDVFIGGLAGRNGKSPSTDAYGSIVASYSSGATITVNQHPDEASTHVGGLVGSNDGTITASYSRSPVKITNNIALVGGLVGSNYGNHSNSQGSIIASYSLGPVEVNGSNSLYFDFSVGGLVGYNWGGKITASYSRSPVKATGNTAYVGGLAGLSWGYNYETSAATGTGTITYFTPAIITASYAMGPVVATGTGSSVGGLVGNNSGAITATYSRSPVKATGNTAEVGGLVGRNWGKGAITASYAIGPVVATGTNPSVGGLVGRNGQVDSNGQEVANSQGTAVDSYWDIGVSGQSSSALGTGMRGTGPTAYTGIYANWNLNLDGVAGKDDPWHFARRQYPTLKYGGHQVRDQVQFYIWPATPVVGERARTDWRDVASWLTRIRGGYVWERSDDGVAGWTVIRSGRQAAIGSNRYDTGSAALFIEPYEANKRFRAWRLSNERGQVYSYITPPATPWGGPTATLTFASGHTAPRVGQAIAISGSNNVRWIRCDDTADNGCDVIVRSATGYTPVAADQGKYIYAYRYYDNSSGVKTMGKTAVIGPVAAASSS